MKLRGFLDKPPGINATYATNRRGQFYSSKVAKDYKKNAYDRLKLEYGWPSFAPLETGEYWVSVTCVFASHRTDVDSSIKILLDIISDVIGIDDRHFYAVRFFLERTSRGNDMVALTVDVETVLDAEEALTRTRALA